MQFQVLFSRLKIEIVSKSDPEITTLRDIRLSLNARFPDRLELSSNEHKALITDEIRLTLQKIISLQATRSEQEDADYALALELSEKEKPQAKRLARKCALGSARKMSKKTEKASPKQKSKRKASNFPLLKTSPQLRTFLNGRAEITSAEVIKEVWNHIKRENLQDPADKRYILSDQKLAPILENRQKVHMFHLSKYLHRHLLKN